MRTAAKQLWRNLGYDTDHPTHIFSEPRFGYRMEKREGQGQEWESSDSSGWAEPPRRHRPSGLAIIVEWWALGEPHRAPSHISKTALSTVKIGPPLPTYVY